MTILLLFLISCTPFVMPKLLKHWRLETTRWTHRWSAAAEPGSFIQSADSKDDVADWTARDDYQLTRLLTESADRSTRE